MNKIFYIVGAICVGFIVWITLGWWQLRDHFPHRKLQQLKVTMTTNDVQKLFGPTRIHHTYTNDASQPYVEWVYGAGLFQAVYMQFTPDGHFKSYRID